ncbi:tRNA (adenosine(37)-N6)-threonylcarbamoyltransferase complex dimerization subunit type 1 TsaB [Rickettsia argasii]|uniref:tRNA threonylcarbamoyl adenosine modification protein YeaZ n=1 Tax=Rickettsia argasii T170-B TaxID=1268837 RepID=A0A0F3RCK8_9RICK|nr:tRNA (adenosine(37)-N6)-threonylcarbamoyltransferase complex dimerization subunit type 1 TsaB [Rickettsia argasii]KJW04160.1 tRNA threonylcarbamoyl adenosine modification protein YeaZ [Rickettsia argasii T170-B]
MKILAFDTANNTASVAISENENILACIEELCPSMQAENLMPMIEDVMKSAKCSYDDLDYLAVTNGPGSFTGIRIGLASAKGILFSKENITAVAVSNFEYAYFRAITQVKDYDKIYVFLNAYRSQLYMQVFHKSGQIEEPLLIDFEYAIKLLTNEKGNIVCCGSGLEFIYHQIMHLPNIITLPRFARVKAWVTCRYIASRLSSDVKLNSSIEPLYIRPPDAKIAINYAIPS